MITVEGLCTTFHPLGYNLTEAEVRDAINSLDMDGDGVINLDDFWATNAELDDEAINEAFKDFDTDHDGYISPSELKHTMANLGQLLFLVFCKSSSCHSQRPLT
jgi:Ca2+-binding EF-hand superfamily protein